jgi:hypothetical protein
MQSVRWIGVLLGLAMIAARYDEAPPVIHELGPVQHTPAPTPKHADRKRLISVITVQNAADGESVISFEATDVADEGDGKYRPLASRTYSLADDEKKGRDLRAKILRDIRSLENDMLAYAQVVGPPKERQPLGPAEQGPGGRQPYR